MADDAYIGEIRLFPYDWAPEGWLPCDGRQLDVSNYQALFSILANTYGGDKNKTFRIPDLRGFAVTAAGSAGAGSLKLKLGESTGTNSVTLESDQCPHHSHTLHALTSAVSASTKTAVPEEGSRLSRLENVAGSTILRAYVPPTAAGEPVALSASMIQPFGGQNGAVTPHENRQPFCAMNFCICVDGEYPVAGS